MTGFSNQNMRLPKNKAAKNYTPHIALIDGMWRVSPVGRGAYGYSGLWAHAYAHITPLNNAIFQAKYGSRKSRTAS